MTRTELKYHFLIERLYIKTNNYGTLSKRQDSKKGHAPGSLTLIGKQKMESSVINLMEYDHENLLETKLESIEEAVSCLENDRVSWINIFGIHDMELMQRLGEIFTIPPLIIEDILNTDSRPVYESGEDAIDVIIVESIDRNIEDLEEQVFGNPDKNLAEKIYTLKTELSYL